MKSIRHQIIASNTLTLGIAFALVIIFVIALIHNLVSDFQKLNQDNYEDVVAAIQQQSQSTQEKIRTLYENAMRRQGEQLLARDRLILKQQFLDNSILAVRNYLVDSFKQDQDIILAVFYTITDDQVLAWQYVDTSFPEGLGFGIKYDRQKMQWAAQNIQGEKISIPDPSLIDLLALKNQQIRSVQFRKYGQDGSFEFEVPALEMLTPIFIDRDLDAETTDHTGVQAYLRYVLGLSSMNQAIEQEAILLQTTKERQQAERQRAYQKTIMIGKKTLINSLSLLLLSACAVFTLAILIGLIISSRISLRIRLLADSADQIAQGNYDQEIVISGQDEVQRLGISFETMRRRIKLFMENLQQLVNERTAKLHKALTQVTKEKQKIREILNNIEQGVFMVLSDGTLYEEYSAHLELMLGSPKLGGKSFREVFLKHIDLDASKKQQLYSTLMMVYGKHKSLFFKFIDDFPSEVEFLADGKRSIFEVGWDPIILPSNDCVDKVIVTLRDITILKNLQAKERASAKAVQEALLTDLSYLPGLTIASHYQSAESTGGDWYGLYHDRTKNRVFIIIGDVTGHGMSSALVTGAVAGAIKFGLPMLIQNELETPVILYQLAERLNQVVIDTGVKAGRLMTMSFIGINQEDGSCHYLNAGHNMMIQLTANKTIQHLKPGSPLGLSQNPEFGTKEFFIKPGESLFLYTDGLVENTGPQGHYLSPKQLSNVLEFNKSPAENIETISKLIHALWEDSLAEDDCTFLQVRFDKYLKLAKLDLWSKSS